MPRSKV